MKLIILPTISSIQVSLVIYLGPPPQGAEMNGGLQDLEAPSLPVSNTVAQFIRHYSESLPPETEKS